MPKALNLLDKPSQKPLESQPEARFHDVAGVPRAEYLHEARAAVLRAGYDMTHDVLIVDDSLTVRMNLREGFRAAGHHTVECATIAGGRTAIAKQVPDLIVLDVLLPDGDGIEFLVELRASSSAARVPVILLSTKAEVKDRLRGRTVGADDYVGKPYDVADVVARATALLRGRTGLGDMLKKDAETESAYRIGDAREALMDELSRKNDALSLHAAEVQRLNDEMRMFVDAVSHDLRQPLRSMAGFSELLLDEYGGVLDERGRHYLKRVQAGAQRMGELVDGLLALSRVSRKTIDLRRVRLDTLALRILARLRDAEPHRTVDARIQPDIEVFADPDLMESVLENLLGNAWKFTSKRSDARVEVAATAAETQIVCHVRDNGEGFDMTYADKLFGAFERLHAASEFEGTGIGLATAQRIVHRHGGRIWAQSAPGQGATFSFSVPGVGGTHASG